jgi:glycolate oxidase FAD binding subunit
MRGQGAIQGKKPRVEVRPADVEHLAAVLAKADAEDLSVCVTGGGTKLGWGNPPARFDVLVRTGDLPKHCDVDADDLTLTVSANTTVAEARAAVRAKGRVLPLDPRLPAVATMGGVVATADQGPRGAGYGAVRDVVLGLRVALVDGTIVKFGGRTMKNVAGYDMTKLFVGSFGSLGLITEVTFRLLPRADSEALVAIPLNALAEGAAISAWLLDSCLAPLSSQCISSGLALKTGGAVAAASAAGAGGGVLLVGFSGCAAAVERSVDEVRSRARVVSPQVLRQAEVEPVYDALDFLAGAGDSDAVPKTGVVEVRATVPVSRVWALADEAEALTARAALAMQYRCDAARGVFDARIDMTSRADGAPPHEAASTGEALPGIVDCLRKAALDAGGQLTVTAGLGSLGDGVDAWGESRSAWRLMKSVKDRFDPRGTLNPGRFVGGV